MYKRNIAFLRSLAVRDEGGYSGGAEHAIGYSRVVRDGVVVANDRGETMRVKARPTTKHLIVFAAQMQPDKRMLYAKSFSGVLAERIATYLEEYYGKRETNCASFVEYLRSGDFLECDPKYQLMMFKGKLTTYQGEKVRPGDSICILYFSHFGKSRRYENLRAAYRRNRKAAGDLTKLSSLERESFDQESLIEFYSDGAIDNYHFMHCIDIHNGMPVFIQQVGRNDPRKDVVQHTPILVSVGMTEMAYSGVQACLFINRKKRG